MCHNFASLTTACGRQVSKLQQEATALFGHPEFYTFHIRRNDFQYKEAWLSAAEIRAVSDELLPEGSLVYIATDEKRANFFQPFHERYKVRYLKDYMDLLPGVNKNLYGMIEQLVASRGERFIGTWWSTFTGYINRMRGFRGSLFLAAHLFVPLSIWLRGCLCLYISQFLCLSVDMFSGSTPPPLIDTTPRAGTIRATGRHASPAPPHTRSSRLCPLILTSSCYSAGEMKCRLSSPHQTRPGTESGPWRGPTSTYRSSRYDIIIRINGVGGSPWWW
jgi:hypothetical protein